MKIFAWVGASVALVVLIGCGGHAESTAGGTTVMTGADTKVTTVTTAGGSETLGGTVAPAMGVPIYPGSAYDSDSQISTTTKKGAGVVAMFVTPNAFSKVETFYKSRLPVGAEKVNMTLDDGSMAEFQVGDQTTKQMTIITVRAKSGPTQVLISTTTRR